MKLGYARCSQTKCYRPGPTNQALLDLGVKADRIYTDHGFNVLSTFAEFEADLIREGMAITLFLPEEFLVRHRSHSHK